MWSWWQRLRGAPPCLLQTVVVNLKDDPNLALEGVLFGMAGRWLRLRNASAMRPGAPPEPAIGELLVPLANVAFLQAVPPETR
jgi:hypothetical protein